MNKIEAVMDWMLGANVGTSSKTMALVSIGKMGDGSHPRDPSDFNRCLKMLEQLPFVRDSFDDIARLSEPWKNIIENWDALEAMFIEDTSWGDGMAPKTYKWMHELTKRTCTACGKKTHSYTYFGKTGVLLCGGCR